MEQETNWLSIVSAGRLSFFQSSSLSYLLVYGRQT